MPTLHLPDHTRPFFLFAHSNQGQALGLLCQRAGDTWAPIAYLSKQLDMLTKGWPPCIQAMAAIAALVPEANKLSRHAPFNSLFSAHLPRLSITSGFPLPSPFQGTGPTCLSPRPSALTLPPALPLTPPAYYPCPTTDSLLHSCSLTVDLTQNPFQLVTDQPILDPDTPHWFVDGSSQNSPPFAAGYAIIQGDLRHNHGTQTIEAATSHHLPTDRTDSSHQSFNCG